MTKLGPHIIGWTHWPELRSFVRHAQPRVIKLVGPTAYDTAKIAELKKLSPSSLWLYRHYVNNQPLDNPIQNARDHARLIEPYLDSFDAFEDYNEIDPRDHSFDPPKPLNVDTIKRYNHFSVEFSRIMHLRGKRTVTGCWSNVQPPDEAWQYMKDALEWADYVSLHGYGWPTMNRCPQFTLRYRHIYHNLLPFKRPLILSEQGMTTAVFGDPGDLGWKSWEYPYSLGAKERQAAAEWAWMLDRANEDPFVFSFHPYTTGRLAGDNWGTHDFTPRLYNLVGDYIKGHPIPDGGGGGSMVDSRLASWREGVPLGNYTAGPTEKTKIVLHSTGGSFTSAVNWFLNPESGFATQYVIGRGHVGVPKIYQLVNESDIGHHAGKWEVNTKSIGIECADDNLDYLMNAQWRRLVALLKDIVERYPHIGRSDIILHRDVVPTKCPQAISDEDRNEIVAVVFGEGVDYKKKCEDLRNGAIAAINTLQAVLDA